MLCYSKKALHSTSLRMPTATNSSSNKDKQGKDATFTPSFEKSNSSSGNFIGSGSKGFSDSKWYKSKDDSSNSKGFTKSAGSDMGSKRKVSFTEKPFETWKKAKSKLTEEEYSKRRRTMACINRDDLLFQNCFLLQKSWL